MLDLTQFTGHTPGPWVAGRRPEHGHAAWVDDSTEDIICTVANKPKGKMAECDANARLIAAAPDLLAEVERLRSFVEIARKVPYSHLIFVPGGYDLLEALAALKEVPTDV